MIKNSVNKLLLHEPGSNELVLLKISLELSLGQIMYHFTTCIKNSICAIQICIQSTVSITSALICGNSRNTGHT